MLELIQDLQGMPKGQGFFCPGGARGDFEWALSPQQWQSVCKVSRCPISVLNGIGKKAEIDFF